MKKIYAGIVASAIFILSANAVLVTSSKQGGIIKDLPDEGQIVKKGDMLVVFSQAGVNADIDALKADMEMAQEDFRTKTLYMNRANILIEKQSISLKSWEAITNDYNIAKIIIDKNKALMRKL